MCKQLESVSGAQDSYEVGKVARHRVGDVRNCRHNVIPFNITSTYRHEVGKYFVRQLRARQTAAKPPPE